MACPSKIRQPNRENPAFVSACLLGMLAALINIVWIVIPTAKYIYSEFPSAETINMFVLYMLVGIVYVLTATILIRLIGTIYYL